jgi:hypothetical protein
MAAKTPRIHEQNVVHSISKTVNFDDTGIASGVVFGTLPAGALILRAGGVIETAFNAATTNVLTIGTEGDSGYDNLATSSTFTEGTPGAYYANGTLAPLSAATDIYVSYTQSGTAATTGKAHVVVEYLARIE